MPLRLKNYTDSLPGGFSFLHPVTGLVVGPEHSLQDLVTAVQEHERAMILQLPGLVPVTRAEVEEQVCRRFPSSCLNLPPEPQEPPRAPIPVRYLAPPTPVQDAQPPAPAPGPLTWKSVIRATKALGRWVLAGRPKPPLPVIAGRAAICRACPQHYTGSIPGCTGCNSGALRTAVVSLVGPPPPEAEALSVCSACGCALPAKVQLPVEFLLAEKDKLPPECWIVTESATLEQNQP